MPGLSTLLEPQPIAPATPHPADFFAALRDGNPFASNRVSEPSDYDVDVPAIHAAEFDRLVALAGHAQRSASGVGAVLLGGAGVGKSHLLSRLGRSLTEMGLAPEERQDMPDAFPRG